MGSCRTKPRPRDKPWLPSHKHLGGWELGLSVAFCPPFFFPRPTGGEHREGDETSTSVSELRDQLLSGPQS